jgi:nicotinate-nucleotide adenylyltransferase
MKKIGIFSGSFNPVHIGHLALANWLCEYEDLEEVWFLVTPRNPLKESGELIDYFIRIEMVKAAVSDYAKLKVSAFESFLPCPSYTIDTLRALRNTYPGHQFYLLIGADNWAIMPQWKDSHALMEEFPMLIYPRLGFDVTIPSNYPNIRKVDAPLLEISSSFIRQAIRDGKDVRFFLPEAIRQNINYLKDVL